MHNTTRACDRVSIGIFACNVYPWKLFMVFGALVVLGCQPSPPSETKDGGTKPSAPVEKTAPDVKKPEPAPLPHKPSADLAEAANAGWMRVLPDVTAGLLTGVAPLGEGVLVTTRDGEVFKVSEAGAWERLGTPLSVGLLDVATGSANGKTVAATLDEEGRIRWSEDQGKTWRLVQDRPADLPPMFDPVASSPNYPFENLVVRRVGDAWFAMAVGGTVRVLFSKDSGKTWTSQDVGGRNPLWNGAIAPDGTLVAVGDRAQVYTLAPNEKEWKSIKTDSKEPWRAAGVTPGPSQTLVVGGMKNKAALRAWEGDESWTRRDPTGASIVSLVVRSDVEWYAATSEGAVITTRDAGKTWKTLTASDGRRLRRLKVSEKGTLLALGPELLWKGERWGKRWSELRGRGIDTIRRVWGGRAHQMAVGDRGLMLIHRQESGKAKEMPWSVVEPDRDVARSKPNLTDVAFAGGRFGWVTASDGRVLSTEDGARTWKTHKVASKKGIALLSVSALDALNVFVGGSQGHVFTSSDRGKSWLPLALPFAKDAASIPDVMRVSVGRQGDMVDVWVGADRGQLFRKDPTRRAFSHQAMAGLGGITDIELVAGRTWLLDLSGMVLRSERVDEWRVLALPPGVSVVDIAFAKGGLGLALGEGGSMMKTVDGGKSWQLLHHSVTSLVTQVLHVSGGRFVIVGHGGAIHATTDAGKTWVAVPKVVGMTLNGVVRDGRTLVACGFGGACVSSSDEGKTWALWKGGPADLGKNHVTAMDRASDGSIALAGVGVVRVRDGSGVWKVLKPSPKVEKQVRELRKVRIGPGGKLFVITANGRLLHRVGDNLVSVPVPAKKDGAVGRANDLVITQWNGSIAGVITANSGLYAVGSTPEGIVLTEIASPKRVTSEPVRRLTMDPEGRVWLLGPGGLWASGKAGAWSQVVPGLPAIPMDLVFASDRLGYAATASGQILQTNDGGESWTAEQTGTRTPLTTIAILPNKQVLAGGQGGVVLRRGR